MQTTQESFVEDYQYLVEHYARKWKQVPFMARIFFQHLTSDEAPESTQRASLAVLELFGPFMTRLWKWAEPWVPWRLAWCHYIITHRRFPPPVPSDWKPLSRFVRYPASSADSTAARHDTEAA